MNFFERQRQVRTASKRLVLLFIPAVLGITAIADVGVFGGAVVMGWAKPQHWLVGTVIASIAVLLMIGGVSFYKTMELRHGGGVKVAESLGAVAVDDMPADPKLRRYRNIVEEVSIASSTPVPVLYYLPGEAGINAFAAGYTPADAAVCVTQGALDRLNRDELQGVIAHEFSHIVNGDMRLSIRLIGLLAGITTLSVIGRGILGERGDRDLGDWALASAFLTSGWLGVFFGRLIKAAVSRQREHLADASAVQFTRQTSGLAGALKKIGGVEAGSLLRSPKAENVSHMLFGEGFRFSSLYATHPPLIERIQALEPHFTSSSLEQLQREWHSRPPVGLEEDDLLGLADARGPSPQRHLNAHEYAAAVGNPTTASHNAGVRIRRAIPQHLADRAHRPATAVPLIYGLIFDRKENVRRSQYDIVARHHGKQVADVAWQCGAELVGLDPSLRLPLASIAFPALRHLPETETRLMTSVIGQLSRADKHLSIFEYCLGTLIFVELNEALTSASPWKSKRQSLASAQNAVACLIAVLACAGHSDPQLAANAFQAGMSVVYPGARVPFIPIQDAWALEPVWPVIDGLEGNDEFALVAAVVTTVTADKVVTVEEAELLRTVCGVLHCPVPPVG